MSMNKRTLAAAHAALDEVAASNAELASALATILKEAAATDTAVQVPSARKPKNTRTAVVEDDEDDLAPAPKSRRNARAAVVEDDEDDADDADDADEDDDDGVILESLSQDDVMDFMDAIGGDTRDDVTGGITEIRAALTEYGVDPTPIEELAGNGARRSERLAVLKSFLSSIKTAVEHIAEYELDEISAAYTEITDEELPRLRGRTADAKALYAADLYMKALFAATEGDDDAEVEEEEEEEEEVKPVRSSRRVKEEVKSSRKPSTREGRKPAKVVAPRRKRAL